MASSEEQLAVFLARTVATQVIGKAAAQVIADPLLSALNIARSSQAEFQKNVTSQLSSIRNTLKDVQESLVKITQAVEHLQHAIDAYAISSALRDYYDTADLISGPYDLFVDGVAELANEKGDPAKAALELWVRLSPPNDTSILNAMNKIHRFVVPNAGVVGLFDHILTGMTNAMTAFAQDGNRYKIEKLGEYKDFWIPSDGGMFSTYKMLTGSFDAAREYLVKIAVPIMKHVLATEIKGLMLLTRSWAGGPHNARIRSHVDNILAHIDTMKRFFSQRAVPAARSVAKENLNKYGKRLKGDGLAKNRWSQMPLHMTGPTREYRDVWPFMMNDDWVMWASYPDYAFAMLKGYPLPPRDEEWKQARSLVMIMKPWEGGTRPVYLLSWGNYTSSTVRIHQSWQFNPPVGDYYTILSPPDFVKRTDVVKFLSERIGEVTLDTENQVGITVPEFSSVEPRELTDLISSLPTKTEQLTA
jgi:hypothetical protein